MQLDLSEMSLPVYEALASDARLNILRLVSERDLNISQLAEHLNLSKAIVTKHVQKLEEAHLLRSRKVPGKSGLQKISELAVDDIQIQFPVAIYRSYSMYAHNIRLGHYTNFDVQPTCGLATVDAVVGALDDPLSFVSSDRVNCGLLWFSAGFVEYKIPCRLEEGAVPKMLEISMEIASEFPLSNNIWPSDIRFDINGVNVGSWTCPGNFSDVRGFYTPSWWGDSLSQYGLLKHLRVTDDTTRMDGNPISDITLADLNLASSPFINFRIIASPEARNAGGVTLFGKGFGNHEQDLQFKLYYAQNKHSPYTSGKKN